MSVKITFIEDSPEFARHFLKKVPEGYVLELQIISNPPFFDKRTEGLIAEFRPELIVLDLNLEGDIESGFRILRQLKTSKKTCDFRVLVCSKFVGDKGHGLRTAKKALRRGACGTLAKIPYPRVKEILKYRTQTHTLDTKRK